MSVLTPNQPVKPVGPAAPSEYDKLRLHAPTGADDPDNYDAAFRKAIDASRRNIDSQLHSLMPEPAPAFSAQAEAPAPAPTQEPVPAPAPAPAPQGNYTYDAQGMPTLGGGHDVAAGQASLAYMAQQATARDESYLGLAQSALNAQQAAYAAGSGSGSGSGDSDLLNSIGEISGYARGIRNEAIGGQERAHETARGAGIASRNRVGMLEKAAGLTPKALKKDMKRLEELKVSLQENKRKWVQSGITGGRLGADPGQKSTAVYRSRIDGNRREIFGIRARLAMGRDEAAFRDPAPGPILKPETRRALAIRGERVASVISPEQVAALKEIRAARDQRKMATTGTRAEKNTLNALKAQGPGSILRSVLEAEGRSFEDVGIDPNMAEYVLTNKYDTDVVRGDNPQRALLADAMGTTVDRVSATQGSDSFRRAEAEIKNEMLADQLTSWDEFMRDPNSLFRRLYQDGKEGRLVANLLKVMYKGQFPPKAPPKKRAETE